MGSQVSTIKAVLAPEGRKKGNKPEKVKIGILSFEVANVMSKIIQLWQSLCDHEILRLRTEVIKSEGVLNLVSDNESILLSLACMEKLQDLTAVAGAVARLGRRCQEPLLQGFESVYNDMLKKKIDVHAWQFSPKEMKAKTKKMEQYIGSTSHLYQELEVLGDLEVASRRIHDDGSGSARDRETLFALEQKSGWHRQEIKYLRDFSLWNRTYDKVVILLARTVFTIHVRILSIFGSPLLGLPQLCPIERRREIFTSPLKPSDVYASSLMPAQSPLISVRPQSSHSAQERSHPSHHPVVGPISPASYDTTYSNGTVSNSVSSPYVARVSPLISDLRPANLPGLSSGPNIGAGKKPQPFYFPLYQHCLHSPTRGSIDFESLSLASPASNTKKTPNNPWSNLGGPQVSPLSAPQSMSHRAPLRSVSAPSGHWQTDLFSQTARTQKIFFDPKSRHHNAPSSTLGGSALALHYANVIIVIEKMIKFPHLISHDARDDLYQMLPRSVRLALRSRLKVAARKHDGFDSGIAVDWKDALERILAWLTPLAHNMIRWQSEHNFEQQQVVARSNILLLQTLYFADVMKCETAIAELLVGLNYLCGHEKEKSNISVIDYRSREADEYLEWQF